MERETGPRVGIQIKRCNVFFNAGGGSGVIDVLTQGSIVNWVYYEYNNSFAYDYPELVPKYIKSQMHRLRREWLTQWR